MKYPELTGIPILTKHIHRKLLLPLDGGFQIVESTLLALPFCVEFLKSSKSATGERSEPISA